MAYQDPYNYDWRYWECFPRNKKGATFGQVNVYRYRCDRQTNSKWSIAAGKQKSGEIVSRIRDRYKLIMGKTQSGNPLVIPQDKKGDWFEGAPLVIDKVSIVRAFAGKGTPEEIELAIQLAIATNRVQADLDAVQKMVDDCIGLDCNGFVGNFFKQKGMTGASGTYGPSTTTETFARRAIKRTKLEDIRMGDVLIWNSPRHIAVVTRPPDAQNWMLVSESAKSLGGLDTRWYKVTGKSAHKQQTVTGGGPGIMFEFDRPNGGSSWKKWDLLVCKVV